MVLWFWRRIRLREGKAFPIATNPMPGVGGGL